MTNEPASGGIGKVLAIGAGAVAAGGGRVLRRGGAMAGATEPEQTRLPPRRSQPVAAAGSRDRPSPRMSPRPRSRRRVGGHARPRPLNPRRRRRRLVPCLSSRVMSRARLCLSIASTSGRRHCVRPRWRLAAPAQCVCDGEDGLVQTIEVDATGETTDRAEVPRVRLNAPLAVVHKHGIGSCDGDAGGVARGISYQTTTGKTLRVFA